MVDVELIKANYSQMADEQLIFFARNEGTLISHEAFIVLKKEFRKRNLAPEVIAEAEKAREDKNREKIINNLEKEFNKANNKLWNEVFQMKSEDKSDNEIQEYLSSEGLSYVDSQRYIQEMKTVAEMTLKNNKRYIVRAICFLLLGVALLIWSYFSFFSIEAVIVGIFVSLSSAAAWARLDAFRTKLAKALKNINEQ
jgi:preprotein translocase subunit SecF